MSVYRCKMCGGDLSVVEGESYCTCEFCGTKQTIPTVTDEGLQNLFNRANLLRMKSEFDKASEIYEKILQQSGTEAEAYWGLILCKYGIEYVDDPATNKRIPTCHRASYDAVTVDEDFKNALKYADTVQRGIYEEQAREIDQLQRGILDIVHKEKPYDVFICYKETDEAGKRTPDSVIANDIYHQLTMEGFKVFYAAITLEDKLGTEYEPYIFSALNTAKVMLAIGTKPEYFNAVWVKNEWSRFLKIMKNDRTRLLIPCYRDMDPYELPEEFAHLQAQDMSKIGFINDIVRGIKKVVIKETAQAKPQAFAAIQPGAASTTATTQIKRGNLALEDHEWEKADGFFEEALNLDPECAEAYLGKLLARDRKPGFASWIKMQKEKYSNASTENLEACPEDQARIRQAVQKYVLDGYLDAETIWQEYAFDLSYSSVLSSRNMQKQKQLSELSADRLLTRAKQYAKGDTKQQIEDGLAEVYQILDERITLAQKQDEKSITRVKEAYEKHLANTDKKIEEMKAEALNRREQRYQDAVASIKTARDVQAYSEVLHALTDLDGYKDSNELAARCKKEIDRLNEEKRQEEERQAAARRQKEELQAKKQKKTRAVIGAVAAICVLCIAVVTQVVIPDSKYNAAVTLMDSKDYEAAIAEFEALNGYKDSKEKILECNYQKALPLIDAGEYEAALALFTDLGEDQESSEMIKKIKEEQKNYIYDKAIKNIETGNCDEAFELFSTIKDYKDVSKYLNSFRRMPRKIVFDDGRVWEYEYDSEGNVIKYIEHKNNGSTVEHRYDYHEGKINSITYPDYKYIFSNDGKSSEETIQGKEITAVFHNEYKFDNNGMIKEIEIEKGPDQEIAFKDGKLEYTYEYGKNGLIKSVERKSTRHYDNDNPSIASQSWSLLTEFNYDSNGFLTSGKYATKYWKVVDKVYVYQVKNYNNFIQLLTWAY